MTAAYCTVEDVKAALDVTVTARMDAQITRHILGVSAGIEGLLNRQFWPSTGVRYFDWPLNYQYAVPWRLWLDRDEILTCTSIVTGNRTLTAGTDFILRPENSGSPYSHIEILVSGTGMWSPGSGSWQQAIAIHGTFGGADATETAGTLAAAVSSTTAATVTVTNSAVVGTLDTILVDTEYMTVTGKTMTTTGQTLQTPVGANKAEVLLTVTNGAAYAVGETVLLDAERMLIVDIAGNSLIVKRAHDGSVLAAHTGSTIYAPRVLAVQRGQWGTTAATHSNGASAARHAPPALVRNLTVATVVLSVLEDTQAWTETKGREGAKAGTMSRINDLRDQCYTQYARQSRSRAV